MCCFAFGDHVNIVEGMGIVLIWMLTVRSMLIKHCRGDVDSRHVDDVVNMEVNPVGHWRVCLELFVRKYTVFSSHVILPNTAFQVSLNGMKSEVPSAGSY